MGHHVATLVALPERDPCRQGMAGAGAAVSHAMERPKPERRNAEEAHLLGIPRGAPVLRIE
ncbi:hypothetical protein AB0F24_18940 [Streptomyces platensis]|uniref:hypothetical protein n=1 Tax=Streptomyces platensis TaxID=58346 RepID=UPI0033ECDD84